MHMWDKLNRSRISINESNWILPLLLMTVRPTAKLMHLIFGRMAGISRSSSACTDSHFAQQQMCNLAKWTLGGTSLRTQLHIIECLPNMCFVYVTLNNMTMCVLNSLNHQKRALPSFPFNEIRLSSDQRTLPNSSWVQSLIKRCFWPSFIIALGSSPRSRFALLCSAHAPRLTTRSGSNILALPLVSLSSIAEALDNLTR